MEIMKHLEKLQKDFLWQGNDKKNKYHFVKWAQVCKAKEERGIGIGSLKEMNAALIRKWLWRLGDGSSGLGKQVLVSKY